MLDSAASAPRAQPDPAAIPSAAHARLTAQLLDLFTTLRLSDKVPSAVSWCVEQVKQAIIALLRR
jgi:hypothetical protein